MSDLDAKNPNTTDDVRGDLRNSMPPQWDPLGPYEVLERLTTGGMAALFLARKRGALGFSRPVVLKVVHTHLAKDPSFSQMLIDEAKIAANIQHPNVVSVEELGEQGGVLYLVMQYVLGCSLSELLSALYTKRVRLHPSLSTHLAITIGEGLHAAHETANARGEALRVVHRDISPQNIMLSVDGHVRIIDFGIAKARNRRHVTGPFSLRGKLRYMSPEQSGGEKVDRRTDVYALGIVLWEMLTLQRYFSTAERVLLIDEVRAPTPRPPSACVDGIPVALDQVVLKALSASPEERYPTALHFCRALAQAVPDASSYRATEVSEVLWRTAPELLQERTESLRLLYGESADSVEELLDPVSSELYIESTDDLEPPLNLTEDVVGDMLQNQSFFENHGVASTAELTVPALRASSLPLDPPTDALALGDNWEIDLDPWGEEAGLGTDRNKLAFGDTSLNEMNTAEVLKLSTAPPELGWRTRLLWATAAGAVIGSFCLALVALHYWQ